MDPGHMDPVWHPRQILTMLDQLDDDAASYTLNRRATLRRCFWVLASVSFALLMIHYMKYSATLVAGLQWLAQWQGLDKNHWLLLLKQTGFAELVGYIWWTIWHVIGYVVIPWIIVRQVFKQSVMDFGWRWNNTGRHWRGYLLLFTPIAFFIVLVSFRQDFLQHYPFYSQAKRSLFDFFIWEALYLLQFVCLEFFFRGYLLNALRPAIGANAIWVMCVPYMMIHLPKLWLEATGAILFGLFLGILALRSCSIWGGVLVHAGVAVSMDIVSLVKQGQFPHQLMPVVLQN